MKLNVIKINGHKIALICAISMGLIMIILIPVFLIISSINKEMYHGIKILFFFFPLIYFVLGYITTRIFVGLFNIVTKWLKGIEIEISNELIEKQKE
jgi:hypothetical protein